MGNDDEKNGLPPLDDDEIHGRVRPWILNRALPRIKVPDTGRAEIRQILYEPGTWLKGEHLPDGVMQPWEKLLFACAAFLRNASGGWGDGQGRLWRTVFRVDPMLIFYQETINLFMEGINGIVVGPLMDRSLMQDSSYRWFMRIYHTINQFMTLFFMLDLGFTPVERVVMFAVLNGIRNVFGAMNGVASTRFTSGLTPLTEERAKLHVWGHVGHKFGYPIGNLPDYILGFARDREHWTPYRVYTRGFMVVLPLALAGGIIHTFARNRVTFDHSENARYKTAAEKKEQKKKKLKLREMIVVVWHNKYMLYRMVANFFTQFMPGYDTWLYWRYMVPPIRMFGRDVHGEGLQALFGQFTGLPITFLAPFMRQIVHKVGGPKHMHIINSVQNIVVRGSQYFVGLHSPGRVVGFFAIDTIRETIAPINGLAEHMLSFEMMDYVEYKTGVRSEGINNAVNRSADFFLKRHMSSFASNMFQSWVGIHEMYDEYGNFTGVSERFARWAWPVWILGSVVREVPWLIANIAFPYKYGQHEYIELELKQRREAAEQAKQALEEELETVSMP